MPRPKGEGEVQKAKPFAKFPEVGAMVEGELDVLQMPGYSGKFEFRLIQDSGELIRLPDVQSISSALRDKGVAHLARKLRFWVTVRLVKDEDNKREFEVRAWDYRPAE